MARIIKRRSNFLKDQQKPKDHDLKEVEKTAINHIAKHDMYSSIVDSLREGIPIPEIARWMVNEGYSTVGERTLADYIRTFKRYRSEILESGNDDYIDSLVASNRPDSDLMAELARAIRLQKRRLKIDVQHEIDMNKLFDHTYKELAVYKDILELYAKVTGSIKTSAASRGTELEFSGEVKDNLRNLKKDEIERDRMNVLADELAKALRHDDSEKEAN